MWLAAPGCAAYHEALPGLRSRASSCWRPVSYSTGSSGHSPRSRSPACAATMAPADRGRPWSGSCSPTTRPSECRCRLAPPVCTRAVRVMSGGFQVVQFVHPGFEYAKWVHVGPKKQHSGVVAWY